MNQRAETVSLRENLYSAGECEPQMRITPRRNKDTGSIAKSDVKWKCSKLVTAEKISRIYEKKKLVNIDITDQQENKHNVET